jgi:hypothetical protein
MHLRCPHGHEIEITDPADDGWSTETEPDDQSITYKDAEGTERSVVVPGYRTIRRYLTATCPDCEPDDASFTVNDPNFTARSDSEA